MESTASAVVDNFACTRCGCVCDDLRVTVRGGRIVSADGACAMAERWLLAQGGAAEPVAETGGQTASLEAAVEQSANLLRSARYPLICGLAQSSTEGQQAGVALAERLGAIIDTTA